MNMKKFLILIIVLIAIVSVAIFINSKGANEEYSNEIKEK